MMARLLLALWLAAAPWAWAADTAQPAAADPALEKRVMALSAELRCLVCQNQSLADSHADLAIDLRNQVRELLAAGKSEAEVKAFMTARYGDFVLYRPPVKSTTVLLWVGPFVLLLVAVAALFVHLARRRRADAQTAEILSGEDAQRARRLLEG